MTNQDRPRIFSHITRSRFLHLEDALTPISPGKPGKIRFFIGEYIKGQGSQATAYHFLDDSDARVVMADLSWARQLDIKDYKGSANGSQPVSRVLKIKGPKDGKYWFQVDNGPGQVIGAGAVKPAGDPTASISIALSTWEARKLALAMIEYMLAWRVTALFGPTPMAPRSPSHMPRVEGETYRTSATTTTPKPSDIPNQARPQTSPGEVSPERSTLPNPSAAQDLTDLFGPDQPPTVGAGLAPAQAKPTPQAQEETPAEVDPPTFFKLANKALEAGFSFPKLQEIINNGNIPWREKHITLAAAMAA